MNVLFICIPILFGTIVFVRLIYSERKYKRAFQLGWKTKGVVVDFEKKWKRVNNDSDFTRSSFPVIQFKDDKGRVINKVVEYGSNFTRFVKLGEEVDLTYFENDIYLSIAIGKIKYIKFVVAAVVFISDVFICLKVI